MEVSPAVLFAALAHDTRLRCMMLLMRHGELCVCELTHALGAAQPHVSRHLASLREAGLVADRRDGLWIHYRVPADLPDWVLSVLRDTARGLGARAPFTDDAAALEAMPNRPGAPQCI